jgi:hypothetical protein
LAKAVLLVDRVVVTADSHFNHLDYVSAFRHGCAGIVLALARLRRIIDAFVGYFAFLFSFVKKT